MRIGRKPQVRCGLHLVLGRSAGSCVVRSRTTRAPLSSSVCSTLATAIGGCSSQSPTFPMKLPRDRSPADVRRIAVGRGLAIVSCLAIAGLGPITAARAPEHTSPGAAFFTPHLSIATNRSIGTSQHALVAAEISPHQLPERGGSADIRAVVHDATVCSFTSAPALPRFEGNVSCSSGTVSRRARIPPNGSALPRIYVFTLTVGAHSGVTHRSFVIHERGSLTERSSRCPEDRNRKSHNSSCWR